MGSAATLSDGRSGGIVGLELKSRSAAKASILDVLYRSVKPLRHPKSKHWCECRVFH
jgi:hypothetical protein